MSNSSLFRIAGFCAILSLVVYVVAFGLFSTNAGLMTTSFIVATVALLVVLYALYVVHRPESSGLALGAGLITAIGTIASLFAGDPAVPANAFLYGASSVVFGVGILLFGWLAYKSSKMPRLLAYIVLFAGALSLLTGLLFLAGSSDLGNQLNFASILPFFAWMIWLAYLFLTGKLKA